MLLDVETRAAICGGLSRAGISLDEVRNCTGRNPVSDPVSRGAVCVLPSQEDEQIARHTRRMVPSSLSGSPPGKTVKAVSIAALGG